MDWALGSYKLQRRFRKFFDDPIERFVLDSDRVVTAKSDGLRSRHSSGAEAFYPWQIVKSISTSGEFLTVTVAGGLMFLIPKDAFVNETDFKAIVSFAAENGLSGKQ